MYLIYLSPKLLFRRYFAKEGTCTNFTKKIQILLFHENTNFDFDGKGAKTHSHRMSEEVLRNYQIQSLHARGEKITVYLQN